MCTRVLASFVSTEMKRPFVEATAVKASTLKCETFFRVFIFPVREEKWAQAQTSCKRQADKTS